MCDLFKVIKLTCQETFDWLNCFVKCPCAKYKNENQTSILLKSEQKAKYIQYCIIAKLSSSLVPVSSLAELSLSLIPASHPHPHPPPG